MIRDSLIAFVLSRASRASRIGRSEFISAVRDSGWRVVLQAGTLVLIGASAICFQQRCGASASVAEILDRARSQIEHQDFNGAKAELYEALRKFPRESGLYDLLGVVEVQQGDDRAAELSFKHAIRLDPKFKGPYLNLGHLYQEQSRSQKDAIKKAAAVYGDALRLDPTDPEANYQSAVVLMRLGDYRTSLQCLDRLPAASQDGSQVMAVRCADHAASGDRARADTCVHQLLSSPDLTESDVVSILPTVELARRDDFEEELLAALATRGSASQGTLIQLAKLYERRGEPIKARELLEKLAVRQPDSVELLTELAHVAEHQRDYKGALGYLAHARDIEPVNPAVHFFFGVVCMEDNLLEEAYASLKKAVSLDPANAYYNLALGLVELQEEPAKAIAAFRRYCDKSPRDPRGHFGLAVAYFYNRDYDLARRELTPLTVRPETAAGAHYFLGRTAQKEGRLSDAERELEEAVNTDPKYADADAELGQVRLTAGEYQKAEQALRRAIEIDHDNYTAHVNLMLLYHRTGDRRAAMEAQLVKEIRKASLERSMEGLRRIVIQR